MIPSTDGVAVINVSLIKNLIRIKRIHLVYGELLIETRLIKLLGIKKIIFPFVNKFLQVLKCTYDLEKSQGNWTNCKSSSSSPHIPNKSFAFY